MAQVWGYLARGTSFNNILHISPKVHRLVEQLVDEGDVVPHCILIDQQTTLGSHLPFPHLLELVPQVGLEDADELEEELEHEGDVGVESGEGDEVEVLVPGVGEGGILQKYYWRSGSC